MSRELELLGATAAGSNIDVAAPDVQTFVDQAIRSSMLCLALGLKQERWVWSLPSRGDSAGGERTVPGLLRALYDSLDGACYLATLGGAADLDPMDIGPSHTALPAMIAASICAQFRDSGDGPETDSLIASSVLSGLEIALRIRQMVTARPGIGLHSPGVFGSIAAAAAGARMLGLDDHQTCDALAIALTRASGLAINSAATRMGLTHFGWGTAHGLEAALLAADGWTASHDIVKGLGSLFGAEAVHLDKAPTTTDVSIRRDQLMFKHYPCNIYLNLVVLALRGVTEDLDEIAVTIPWIPHLDCPAPSGVREARNSAQAVAAIAGAGGRTYADFSGVKAAWDPPAEVRRLLPRIRLTLDKQAPTTLSDATVSVVGTVGQRVLVESTRMMADLSGWGADHAAELVGDDTAGEIVAALYGGGYMRGYRYLDALRMSE